MHMNNNYFSEDETVSAPSSVITLETKKWMRFMMLTSPSSIITIFSIFFIFSKL